MSESERFEVRITGFGGQGVVLSGHILGRACAIHDGRNATMIQSFGPEARGSSCSATLVISPEPVLYPYVQRPSLLIAMSSEGYEKYREELVEDGTLIYEQDLVKPSFRPGQRAHGIPSTRLAEGLGRAIVQNIVMVGFVTAASGIAPREAVREAVERSVPQGTEELNLRAFDAGLEYFDRQVTQPVLDRHRPPLEEVPS